MTAKHTPGPWEVVNKYGLLFVQAPTPEGHPYKDCTSKCEIMSDEDYPTKEDDVHLIAAAPDLLAALKDIVAEYYGGLDIPQYHLIENASAAIDKAEGGAQ